MSQDLQVPIVLGPVNAQLLGLDRDELTLDLSEVEIGESVEIQRRLGLTPAGLALGLATQRVGSDALVTLAAVWLALRQAGHPRRWDEIRVRTYLPAATDDADGEGKGSTSTGPSAS